MGLMVFILLMAAALLACGLALRDVLRRSEEEFNAVRQSRNLWRGVLIAMMVMVVVLPSMFPAALAIASMYFFVYRRRIEKAADGPIDVEEG